MSGQAALLELGAAAGPRCPRCDAALASAGASCRPCTRDLPPIGSDGWRRWRHGIGEVVKRRLCTAGAAVSVIDVLAVVLFDEARELAPPVRALVADLLALPCSPARHERAERRAKLCSLTRDRLVANGVPAAEADRRATEAADFILAEDDAAGREGRAPAWGAR